MFFFLFNLFNPILIAAAVLPAAFLMYKIYKMDKLESEPPSFLIRLMISGCLAALVAMALEWLGGKLLVWLPVGSGTYEVLFYFIVVALSEEGAKYYFLRKRTWFSEHFNCLFDGVVYAVCVSLGFALLENLNYVMEYGFSTALVRAVTAIPGHASFGVFMGVWYSAAKKCDNFGYPEKSRRNSILCVAIPTLLHGAYDYIATRMSNGSTLFFIAFVAALFLIAYKMIRKSAAQDQYIY